MNKKELLHVLKKNKSQRFLFFENPLLAPMLIMPMLYTDKQLDYIFQDTNNSYRYKLVNGTLAGEEVVNIYRY